MAALQNNFTRVLGIDPGWKNLAFCVFEYTDNYIEIVRWEIVDLFPEDALKPTKKKTKLTKTNAAAKTRKRNKRKPLRLCNERLQHMMAKKKWEKDVHLVAIEDQPGGPRGNNTSRCISFCIHNYLLHFGNKDIKIDFVHPKTKRTYFVNNLQTIIEKIKNKRERYNKTKTGAVDIVQAWIDQSEPMPQGLPPLRVSIEFKEMFETAKKKDDLADSFLLGLLLLQKQLKSTKTKIPLRRVNSRKRALDICV